MTNHLLTCQVINYLTLCLLANCSTGCLEVPLYLKLHSIFIPFPIPETMCDFLIGRRFSEV